ncbi:MAG: branched-chain amino acid ABC transporter substrate-binding protein, partial [Tardiphaga sp.]
MMRRMFVGVAMAVMLFGLQARAETVGVTDTEIKIGATFPFSGPASPLSNTGKGLIAYVNS